MALTLTRFTDLRSEQDEEEEKKKKTSGSARLQAAMENEAVPQPTKTPETKTTGTAKLSGSARLQAAMETEPAKTTAAETKTPQISNTYREVDKENGRIRTRSADLSTPNWQDDPDELAAETRSKGNALQLTQNALSMAGAMKQAADQTADLYERSLQKYQGILDDKTASKEDKWNAARNLEYLKPAYTKIKLKAQQADSTYNAGSQRLGQLQQSYDQSRDKLVRTLGLGEAKAKEYEKQAQSLRTEADKQYRSGQANSLTLRQAENLEAKAAASRGNYASYLYLTKGEEAANKYAAGEREKEETASLGKKILNTLGGSALNFVDKYAGAPITLLADLMGMHEEAEILRNNSFNEEAQKMQQNAGKLGGDIVNVAGAAGHMMSLSSIGGMAAGAIGSSSLATSLGEIANSSPLVSSAAARAGAKLVNNLLTEVISNPGNAAISLSSGVSGYYNARDNGASSEQALTNGILKGLSEYYSNKLFSGMPLENTPGEKGYVTEAIEYIAKKLGKNEALATFNTTTAGKILGWIYDKAGEGLEEVVTGIADPIIDRITYDKTADWKPKADELIDEFTGGVLLSLLMSGGEAALKPSMETAQIRDELMSYGYSKEIANTYAPQIRKAFKAAEKMTQAIQKAAENRQTTPETTLARIVDKVTQGETLTGQDARKILRDPEAMQALIDGGYLGGNVKNDSDGRKEIVRAAEEYAEENAAQDIDNATETNMPPVPGQMENAPETARTTENNAQIGEKNAQNPEKPLSGIERLNAARDESKLRLPTEAKLTLKGTDNNGQTETSRNAGKIVLGGSGERGSGLRAGEQAGRVGRSPEGWRTLSRPEKAAARRAYADDVGVQPVQAKSLGITAAAEDSTVRVYPREAWEPDLQRIAGKVEKATGKPVTFVLGAMKVNADGVALTVRGVNTGKGIIVQADDPSISAEKIATHEAFHAFAAQDPELSAQVLKQIRKNFPENRLREIAGTYLDKLYGIVDLDSTDRSVLSKALERVRDEICADAYAGINAFTANADEYTGAARQAVTEARREAAAATERRTGPPESYSATDSDTAYLDAVEAGDMETYNRTALITEDTVDKWLKDYAAKSSPKYAQAYITRMTPKQFVDLTTSTTGRLLIGNQTGALDAEKLIEATRDQPLQIQISEGEVVGHEGRHRATALSRAGINSIPVLVFDYSNKYSKTDVPEMILQGQDFGHSRSYATETLRDLIPLSYENRDRIVQEYGTQSATERLQEKYNGQNTIRFSTADDEEIIPESAAEYGQMKRQGKYKAPKITKPVSKSTATIAKADLRKALMTAYSIPDGSRGEIGKMIDALADQYIKDKSISWNNREDLINKLWESGVMHMEADDGYQAVRELVNRGRIYVPERIKNEFGDDWNSFRREAMGQGIYLVNDENAAGWDQWNAELSDAFPGIFPEDEYDGKNFLENLVDVARKGKGENLSLAEYAAKTGGYEYATEEDMMDNLERQADYALKAFADKANLEIYLKDRTGVKIAQERQRMGELMDKAVARERERGDKRVQAAKESGVNALAKEKQREEDRRQKEREHRKEVAQRLRKRQAMRELQQKTLKQLQWLSRNQNKFPAEAKKQVQDLLEDMDVLAVSTAEEMHIDNATGKTWKDLRDMYLEAKEKDPNWLPSAQLEKIVMRLDAKKIGDLDMGALQDLYKAAIGLRTELYNRNNLINDELHRTLDEVYESAKTEIQEAKGGYKAGLAQRYADMQLTPMNRFLKMAGWNPDSTWYGMAKGLEAGERAQRKFKTESQRQIAPVLEQYKDWMKTADGQGKNAKWYEIKVPESWEYHMGDKPIFSDKTVTVYMTPAQKVHMYLESKNPDNLRHMEGGRTFADKELYSKEKRAEAFANGTTVKLLPETVKNIVSDLTAEEQALANALEQYYNNFSKQEINKVSNILYGYDKAMGGYYAPIFTNDNYTKSDPGVFDLTAEGVGNLKARQHAANPSWNISAFDAFERSVDRTGKFVGLAIPIRNMNTLWNWRESGNSMKDVVSHKWNKPGTQFVSDLMTELQSGRDITHPKIEQLTNAALSKYIGATFGFNPSIVLKQFASFPLAGTYLGNDNLIKGILRPAADTDLISKYTGELDYRLLGYATPETATLKNNPSKLQEKGPLNFMFGGGAITWMDGLTVRTLWNGAEQKVKSEQPDLEVGTQEQIDAGQSPFYQAVAKEFEEAVSRSQPMYDTMHRADIMREGDPITRTFTLFKTVPMQELNMLAQTIGEANYYKSIGADKATQTAARQKAGRAFLGILTGNLMIGVISFLNALLKNGAKAYKDKDGELNAKSIVTGMLKQYAKDAAGLALGGSEAADILSAILFGDKWYGLETPGIEQISSIVEKTIKASTKTANMVKDSVDVLENGGDWFQYMRDHGGDYVSSVEEIGRMLATYGTGLPVDNVKAYLLGAAQHISPAIKTAYEDIMSKADKSGLKGLNGAALEMRTGHILQDRAGETSERTVETIAGLYEAGYTDAVPATIQSSYSVNGETRKLSAAEDQLYRQVWRNSVSGALDDLTRDKVFRNMGQADQAKVLKKLYDYGAQNAKETVWPDYNPDKWVTTAKGLEAKDVPLSEWLPIQQELSKISGKNKKQEIRDYIDSLPYSRDQKKAMYTAEGYQDADDVNWHSGSYGGSSGKGKTYSPADTGKLRLPPSARMDEQDRELWDMESHGGNVNLRTRKTIPVTRDNIETVRGWGMDSNVGDYMTVASQTYRDGNRAIVVTPILPNGKLMTQAELDDYMDSLRGSDSYADADDRGIILGVFDDGNWQQNLKKSDAFAERIHELHEEREEKRKTTGLKLPSAPQARPTSSGLKLTGTPQARTGTGGLRTK